MVDMNVVNDDIGDILKGDATTTNNMNISSSSIKSLVTVEY